MRNVAIGCLVLFAMTEPAFSQTKELPKELAVDLGGGVKLDLVLIPAGSFTMGDDNETAHKVRITKPFYLGKYEVTQEQWKAVMGSNPSHFNGPKNPVEQVNWDDCQQFLVKLNTKSSEPGSKFVLPTEAQWEYACRAGSTSKFCFGDDEKQLGEYAWFEANSGDKTHPVGEKKPNAFGLHDMHGNVGEWCQDWYGAYGNELVEPGKVPFAEEVRQLLKKAEPLDDPRGPTKGSSRVGRGGGWLGFGSGCQSALRNIIEPGARSSTLGLRVARVRADLALAGECSQSSTTSNGKDRIAQPAAEMETIVEAGMETIVKAPGFGWLNYVCYSPDQKEFARVAAFGDVISEIASWKKHRVFDVGIRMVAYSPDGTTMATAEGNDGARIWKTADRGTTVNSTAPELGEITGLTNPVHVLLTPAQSGPEKQVLWTAYSPDGSRLITALSSGHMKAWKTDSGEEQAEFVLTTAPLLCASFHPDGKRVAAGDQDGVLHFWDLETNKAISAKATQIGAIASVTFSPDGTRLVTAHRSDLGKGSVMIWNTADWVAQTEPGYWSAAFSKDGKILALGGGDIRLLAPESLQELRRISLCALSQREAALRPGAEASDQKMPVWVQALAWRPDGRELAAGCFDGTVRLLRIDP